jgi:broad specificity phosphatase PhoE
MKIIIIRHSIREISNDIDEGDVLISKEGHLFAQEKAIELKKQMDCSNMRIISSPLKRTIDTANIFSNVLENNNSIKQDYRFIENMKTIKKFSIEHIEGMNKCGITFGETLDDVKTRTINMLHEIEKNNEDVIIVTHGIIYNCILQHYFKDYIFDTESNDPVTYFPPYCSITILEIESDKIAKHIWSNTNINFV